MFRAPSDAPRRRVSLASTLLFSLALVTSGSLAASGCSSGTPAPAPDQDGDADGEGKQNRKKKNKKDKKGKKGKKKGKKRDPNLPPLPARPGRGKVPTPPTPEALAAAVDEREPPMDFWKDPKKHCGEGGKLDGEAKAGKTVRCLDAAGARTGPFANFHRNGALQMLQLQEDGKTVGKALWFHDNGQKAWERRYLAGEMHGPATGWGRDGKVIAEESYKAGRPWGTFVYWDLAGKDGGKELARSELPEGTGLLVRAAGDEMRSEENYKHGLRHGETTMIDMKGVKRRIITWAGGEMHGAEKLFDESGKLIREGANAGNRPIGAWLNYDAAGALREVEYYTRKRGPVGVVLWQDGKRLGKVPDLDGAWLDDKEIAKKVKAQASIELGNDDVTCTSRPQHFPQVVEIGQFANDRGCATKGWLVDGKWSEKRPATKLLLERAGWPAANPANRERIATEFVREIAVGRGASILTDPSPLSVRTRDDGAVEVTAHVSTSAGGRGDKPPTVEKKSWVFLADGSLEGEPADAAAPAAPADAAKPDEQ
jgi:antitoxin component YwqK of YwqJK toxin-antitoxin module